MEGKYIEYFQVEIKPWRYPTYMTTERILEIRVDVNGQRYGSKEIVKLDDFHSMLDYLFDRTKAEFEKAITDQQEQNRDR